MLIKCITDSNEQSVYQWDNNYLIIQLGLSHDCAVFRVSNINGTIDYWNSKTPAELFNKLGITNSSMTYIEINESIINWIKQYCPDYNIAYGHNFDCFPGCIDSEKYTAYQQCLLLIAAINDYYEDINLIKQESSSALSFLKNG